MTFKLTGHAEIDHQHAVLDELVGRLEHICTKAKDKPGIECHQCAVEHRQTCSSSLASLCEGLLSFLVGHVTYEERLMELLPDIKRCQFHIMMHKDAHADISERLSELSALIGKEDPKALSTQLHLIVHDWIGDHASQFDVSLAYQLESLDTAEIEFDGELVTLLDELVFRHRPTGVTPTAQAPAFLESRRTQVQLQIASLTARQREVFQLMLGGMANKAMAKQLGTTINTIKTHRAEIFRKMKVTSLLDLVRSTNLLRR